MLLVCKVVGELFELIAHLECQVGGGGGVRQVGDKLLLFLF